LLQRSEKQQKDKDFETAVGYMEAAREAGRIPNPSRDVPEDLYKRILANDPAKIKTLNKWRNAPESDLALYAGIKEMWSSNSPELKNMSYADFQNRYFGHLTAEDYRSADAMWRDLHKAAGGGSKVAQLGSLLPIARTYTDNYLKAAGLDKGAQSPKSLQRRASMALSLANQMSEKAAKEGRTKLTDVEMKSMLDTAMKTSVMEDNTLSRDREVSVSELFMNPARLKKTYVPMASIPPEDLAFIQRKQAENFSAKGEITDTRVIERLGAAIKMRNIDLFMEILKEANE
jgi:hypothetical protein